LLNKKDTNGAFTKRTENTRMLKNQWTRVKLKVLQSRFCNEIIILNKV